MKRFVVMCLGLAMVFMTAGESCAEILFSDNFDDYSLECTKWTDTDGRVVEKADVMTPDLWQGDSNGSVKAEIDSYLQLAKDMGPTINCPAPSRECRCGQLNTLKCCGPSEQCICQGYAFTGVIRFP